MKIISLNCWCGIRYEGLMEFIERQALDTDIFCLQEVRNGRYVHQPEEPHERIDLFDELSVILPEHEGRFVEMTVGVGLAAFIRKDIPVEKIESACILSAAETAHILRPSGGRYYPRKIQSIHLKDSGLIIHNFHGFPGGGKKDAPERALQTDRLLEIISQNHKPQIIIGDFNLGMETDAVSRLGQSMRNLVKEGGFTTTRNSNYNERESQPFADYAFVTPDMEIKSFQVLQDDVSDHLPLELILAK